MTNKFTLLVVDCQNDFTSKKGTMYVKNAEKALKNIYDFIEKNASYIDKIILTADMHPDDHMSFTKNGGEWPEHCIANSWGSKIDETLLNVIKKLNIPFRVLYKGEVNDFEEYSASTYSEHIDGKFILKTNTDSAVVLTNDIVVCGMPGDVSVTETLRDLTKSVHNENVHVYLEGVASMDDNNVIMNLLEDKTEIQIMV